MGQDLEGLIPLTRVQQGDGRRNEQRYRVDHYSDIGQDFFFRIAQDKALRTRTVLTALFPLLRSNLAIID